MSTIKKSAAYFVLMSAFVILFFVFSPYLIGKIYVSNDYMDIPEQTIMSTGLVDNSTYINAHGIGGLFIYNPLVPAKENLKFLPRADTLKVNLSPLFKDYYGGSFAIAYFPERSTLLIRPSLLNPEYYPLLLTLLSHGDKKQFFHFFESQNWRPAKPLTPEEHEFVLKNRIELKNQAIAGHYFHHLSASLGVINEYALGMPKSQVSFFYGYGNTLLIGKLMHTLGGINFQNYVRVFYSFYPLYYLLLLGVSALVFRDIWYVALTMLIALACQQSIGFEEIRYAPGFNPIRHFFDLPALLFLYAYLRANSLRTLYLLLALASALSAVFFSQEFGIFIFLSLWATLFFFDFLGRPQKIQKGAILVLSFLAFVLIYLALPKGQHSLLTYNLLGVSVPPTPKRYILALSMLISAVYFFLLKVSKDRSAHYPITWFLFFYIQATSIYFIWYFELGHLLVMGTAIALLSVLLLRQLSQIFSGLNERSLVPVLTGILFLCCYLPSVFVYFYREAQYDRIFKTHTVYQWNFPTAKFYSTMNPAPFSDAVKLIQKYSPGNDIYIISKYDNFLPFLAGKYSAMPFIEMQTSLVTSAQMNLARDIILQKKPRYLFVDTDINFPLTGDIYVKKNSVTMQLNTFDLSYGRAQVLATLHELFNDVSKDYVPLERSGLVTVYQRVVF